MKWKGSSNLTDCVPNWKGNFVVFWALEAWIIRKFTPEKPSNRPFKIEIPGNPNWQKESQNRWKKCREMSGELNEKKTSMSTKNFVEKLSKMM